MASVVPRVRVECQASSGSSSKPSSAVPWNTRHRPKKKQQELQSTDVIGYRAVLLSNRPNRTRKKKKNAQPGSSEEQQIVLGIVDDVIDMDASGGLLRIIHPVHIQQEVDMYVEEEHLVPFVDSIVPHIDVENEEIVIDPPDGLLELGKRKVLMDIIEYKISPIVEEMAASRGENISGEKVLMMPTRRELEDMGRRDIVKLVMKAGGFLEVAQYLGYTSIRRPPGYWEDETTLDRELSLFVAANWVKFHAEIHAFDFQDQQAERDQNHDDEEEEEEKGNASTHTKEEEGERGEEEEPEEYSTYWFNTVTRRMKWTQPTLPRVVQIDDQGTELFAETEEDRAMPSRSALLAAGRYDLHGAIVAAGGYAVVAEMLDRWPAWPPTHRFKNPKILKSEIEDFIEEHDLPKKILPSASDFLNLGRPDMHQAILRAGGYSSVATQIKFSNHRKQRGLWKDFDYVCEQVLDYAQSKAKEASGDPSMPTHEELRRAGRHDLRHALQKHGSKAVSEATGLPMNRQGGKSRVNRALRSQLEYEFALSEKNAEAEKPNND
ncbi:hypothetical protein M9434_004403 [Picochlorum sp. BPE23]|nr:hypothetical protein M9434_004403 [Picochlorum sp. BPE23]